MELDAGVVLGYVEVIGVEEGRIGGHNLGMSVKSVRSGFVSEYYEHWIGLIWNIQGIMSKFEKIWLLSYCMLD